jgi:hypothetical protein
MNGRRVELASNGGQLSLGILKDLKETPGAAVPRRRATSVIKASSIIAIFTGAIWPSEAATSI